MKIAEFKLEEWMNKYESSAKYDLTTTCIEPLSIFDLCKNFPKDILSTPLNYGEITGTLRLKKAISSLYRNADANNITVTHGAIGANQLVFLSLIEPNDEVVSIVPTYQQHYSIPQSLGGNVKLLFLKEKNNWLPDLQELDSIVTPKTKLICLNNPNNPTGSVIPNGMLNEIAKIAEKNNSWILSDEVYRGLNIIGNRYSDSISDIYKKGISVGSMSKTYSLPGLRVGWIVAREDLIKEINHQRQYNTISISILDDYFAAIALENREFIEERNHRILKEGLQILSNWIDEEPLVECILPAGGTTALIKILTNTPSEKLCKSLQNKTGVAILPGSVMEMEGYYRIGICSKDFKTALENISYHLKSLN